MARQRLGMAITRFVHLLGAGLAIALTAFATGARAHANIDVDEHSVAKFDRFYDPNGDGVLSLDELKAWDPNLSPPPVANDLRRFDNTGNLQHPIIIGHGSHDPIVSPGETHVYKRLVEARFGVAGARDLLAVYWIPGMGHGGAEFDAMIGPALDALEAWVDYRESGGQTGSPPPDVMVGGLGSYPRD